MIPVATPAPSTRLDFDLPTDFEAAEPPEARGLSRDGVRMLVAHRGTEELADSTFALFPMFLDPGDLVVINTSGTLPAALNAIASDGSTVVLHLSTRIDDEDWIVEPRRPVGSTTRRWTGDAPPRSLVLGEGASMELIAPYGDAARLWSARVRLPEPPLRWLARNGRPIRYRYVQQPWSLDHYQNVYVTEPGSAEMPSAGRPFTPEVITRLVAKGVGVTPVVLHTGVASLEADELPYPERVRVPLVTAQRVNATHEAGGRVIAIGTTVVRALETAATTGGIVEPVDGWSDLVITPERGVDVVDGMLTGWHEPEASHLLMLEAVAGRRLIEDSYAASLEAGYLWHEFGDVHLLLP